MENILPEKAFLQLSIEVKKKMDKQRWLQLYGFEFIWFLVRLFILAMSFLLFINSGIWYKIIGMLGLSYTYYGIGISGNHEAGHRSLSPRVGVNKVWGYFFSDFWTAQSSLWWYHRHVLVHHVYTNMPEKEGTLFFYPWLNRYLYFFFVPFLVNFWLVVNSVIFLWRKWGNLALYLLCATLGWTVQILAFAYFMPFGQAILSAFIMRTLFAPIFVHIAVFNHIDLDNLDKKISWLPHQTRTTRNLKKHWFITGMGGNAFVQCHVEHHLFPKLSNRMLAKIRPLVKEYVIKEGFMYIEDSYWVCLKNCLDNYENIFGQWSPVL